MKTEPNWKAFWEEKFGSSSSDYEADRGTTQRDERLERLSCEELLEFVQPQGSDTVFDAGCGSGTNIILFHDKVDRIIAMDFAASAVERARIRASAAGITNATITQGDIAKTGIGNASIDKILCMSVFHYLSDGQVRDCLHSFRNILRPGGKLIIHVKNLSSLYIGTLVLAKAILRKFRRRSFVSENFRSFQWYIDELRSAGFEIEEFNSFNLLIVERMPKKFVEFLQKQELANRKRFPFDLAFCRRHGADLKIRACAR